MTVKQLKNIIADENDSMEVILLRVDGEEHHFSLGFAGISENGERLALEVVEEIKV